MKDKAEKSQSHEIHIAVHCLATEGFYGGSAGVWDPEGRAARRRIHFATFKQTIQKGSIMLYAYSV